VGLAHRIHIPPSEAEPRFIADAMLEKLARWLRLLGIDCAFERGIADDALVKRAIDEGRTILTRDRRLAEDWRVDAIVEVPAGTISEQLADVVDRCDLARRMRPFTRCSRCNVEVEDVSPNEVSGRVPERILSTYERFVRCPSCGTVHWAGTHTARMNRVIDSLRKAR